MNSRERILAAINHKEPDKVPFDLGGTTWTGIANGAYQNLLAWMGKKPEAPEWSDVVQQIVIPSDDVLSALEADTRGLFPLTGSNWDVWNKLTDKGDVWEYLDEWGVTLNFPKINGLWFSYVKHPMENTATEPGTINGYNWPFANDKRRIAGLKEQALKFKAQGKVVMMKGLCAGIFEMHQRCRGMENALLDSFLYPDFSDMLVGKITDLKIAFWEMALAELADVVDIVAEGDDYGTQESQLIDPDHFKQYYKPHISRLIRAIKKSAPNAKVMFHSCGNVRPEIPDFIEMGIDILNPVHVNATGMEPVQLKRDFGKDLVFWGGGVDTQKILPSGTVSEVADDVKKNIEALAPDGGFVFATVHNIQSEVPPQNIMSMWETLQKYGKY